MSILNVALLQLCCSDDPAENLAEVTRLARQAAIDGADLIATPEMTNIISLSHARQEEVLCEEGADPTLQGLTALAAELGVWFLIGSLALRRLDEARFANRSFLISPEGALVARYDKIHMFDATPRTGEAYRESRRYRGGDKAVMAATPWGGLGMTICYDMRFPELYTRLARAGARVISVPSAFTRPTGAAHWEPLLRARAIETGCFVIAPAQCGEHPARTGKRRQTWGHSLIVSPWGEVLGDGGDDVGVIRAALDLREVAKARAKIPSLWGAQAISGP